MWGFESLAGHHFGGVLVPTKDLGYLAYPALIEVAGTTGSGFHIYDSEAFYLVSAAHVLFKGSRETFREPMTVTSLDRTTLVKPIKHQLDCETLFANNNLLKHPDGNIDVAVCRLGTITRREGAVVETYDMIRAEGVTPIGYDATTFIMGTPLTMCLRLEAAVPGEKIYLLGYPTSLAHTESALDRGYPLLRSGIIAGKPPSNKIIIDCPTYPGNSGGLVMRAEDQCSIGVAIRNIGFVEKLFSSVDREEVSQRRHNSGYTVVEPMDRVIEVIDELKRLSKSTSP